MLKFLGLHFSPTDLLKQKLNYVMIMVIILEMWPIGLNHVYVKLVIAEKYGIDHRTQGLRPRRTSGQSSVPSPAQSPETEDELQ